MVHFACSWAYFDDETGVHSISGVKSSKYNVKPSKYLQQERNNDQFSSQSIKCLRFACCCACFDAKNYVPYIRYVKCNKNAFKPRNIAIWSESALNFRQNRVNGCILRAAGPISAMKQECIALVA